MEFLVVNAPDLYLYKYNATFGIEFVKHLNAPSQYIVNWGDFNGDGISDILYRDRISETELGFRIALGTGTDFLENVSLNLTPYHTATNIPIVVADINNDGYDDILTFVSNNNSGIKVRHYLGSGFHDNAIHFSGDNIVFLNSPVILSSAESANNFTIGIAAPEDKMLYYQRMAESYNSCGYLSENDEILRNRVGDVFDVDFDWNISKFTTYIDKEYGLTENGIYVNLKTKGLVSGYVKRFPREVHISYHYANASNMEFMECVGHELIHAYHLYTIPSCYRIYSERVAYQYSYNIYLGNGCYSQALKIIPNVSIKGYWGYYPPQYMIPFPLFHLC